MDKTEYKGSWWLPEKPGTVVTGSLQFGSDGGITLDLQGTLTDNVHHPQSVTLILGHSTEGDTITLYGCIQINFSLGTVRTTTFYVSAVLIGAHFQSPEKLAFRRFAVTYPQLDYWFGTSGVHVEFPDTHTLTITKKSSFLVSAECGGTKISPGFLFTTHYGRDEVSVKYVPDFVVEMTNEVPLKQSLRLLHHLRNFLALAVSHPVYPDSIDGFTDSVKATLTDGTTVCRQIKILYRRVNWGVSHDSVNINGMLFKLSDVRSEFESLLKNWFDKIDVLEPVFDMYFGVMYNPGMYVQHVFLSLVQCVESYHRRVVHNYELPLDQAEKRKKDILNAVPVEHMEWLKNKLRHSNDLTLRKRLQELLTTYSFLELDETGTFIDDVINTRNYLTHYDKELKTLAVIPEKISTLSMKLRLLTEAILLTELGLSPDTVKFIMKQIKEHRSQIRSYDF